MRRVFKCAFAYELDTYSDFGYEFDRPKVTLRLTGR